MSLFFRVFRSLGLVLLASVAVCVLHSAEVDAGPLTRAQQYERFLQRPVTPEDYKILKRAEEILSDESKWNRHDTRQCSRAEATSSLFCALVKACFQIVGEYQHRRVAIEEVRFVVREIMITEMTRTDHPLMAYNNAPTTKFEDIVKILKIAESRVAARLK